MLTIKETIEMFDVKIVYKNEKNVDCYANSLDSLINENENIGKPIILFGNGGDGKTYSLYKFWKNNSQNTIYIKLYALNKQDDAILNYIQSVVFSSSKNNFGKFSEYYRRANRVSAINILLDGFNEIADTEFQQQILREIKNIQLAYNAQVVVTSRYVDILNVRMPEFFRADLIGLEKEQIISCLESFYIKIKRKIDIKRITENKTMLTLFKSPLMLSLFMQTSPYYDSMFPGEDSSDLHNTIKFISPEYSDSTIIWNYLQSEIIKTGNTNPTETILSYIVTNLVAPFLAYKMQKNGLWAVSESELRNYLVLGVEYCRDIINKNIYPEYDTLKRYYTFNIDKLTHELLLDFMLTGSNPLLVSNAVVTAGKKTTYGFFHQQLRDCLAAIFLINEIKFSNNEGSYPEAWVDNLSANLFMVRHVAYLENRSVPLRYHINSLFNKLRISNDVNNEFITLGVYNRILENLILTYKYSLDSDFSQLDFSHIDLKNISLDEYNFQPSKNVHLFEGAIFGTKTFSLKGHLGTIYSLDTQADKLLSADEYSVRLWSIGMVKCIDVLHIVSQKDNDDICRISAKFLPGIEDVVAYSDGNNIVELTLGVSIPTIFNGDKPIFSVSYSPNTNYITAVYIDGNTRVWERSHAKKEIFFSDRNDLISLSTNCLDKYISLFAKSSMTIIDFVNKCNVAEFEYNEIIKMDKSFDGKEGNARASAFCFDELSQKMFALSLSLNGENESCIYCVNFEEKSLIAFYRHKGIVMDLKFSPNGKLLASGSNDGTSIIMNIENPSDIVRFNIMVPVRSISFLKNNKNANTKTLFSGDISGNITLDYKGKDRPYISNDYNGKNSIVFDIDLNPINHKYCLAAYDDGFVRKWNIQTGQLVHTYSAEHLASVCCVKYSPNADYFASGSEDASIVLWNSYDNAVIKRFKGHEDGVCDLKFNNAGNLLISCSKDLTIRVWDIEQEQNKILHGHNDFIAALCYYEDDEIARLVSCSADGYIFLWDFKNVMETNNKDFLLRSFKAHENRIRSLCLAEHDDKTTFLSNSDDGTIKEWYISDGTETGRSIATDKGTSELVAFNFATGDVMFDCDSSNFRPFQKSHLDICVLTEDPTNNEREYMNYENEYVYTDALEYHNGSIYTAHFMKNGSQIISGSLDGSIIIYDIKSQKVINIMIPTSELSKKLAGYDYSKIIFSPDFIRYQYTGINMNISDRRFSQFANSLNQGIIENIFDFITDETDIAPLVDIFIYNTRGLFTTENKINQERYFILSNVHYLWSQAPKEEQNMFMMAELFNAGLDIKELDEDYKTDLDRLFDRLEEKDSTHVALKFYQTYKKSRYGMKMVIESCYTRLFPIISYEDYWTFPLKPDALTGFIDSFFSNFSCYNKGMISDQSIETEKTVLSSIIFDMNSKFNKEDKNDRLYNKIFLALKNLDDNNLSLSQKKQVQLSIGSKLGFFTEFHNYINKDDYSDFIKKIEETD